MSIDIIDFLLAITPIIWLFIALLGFKMEGHKATFGALVLSSLIALLRWEMPALNVGTAVLEGVLFTLWPILLVVIAAVFTYRVITLTGALENIQAFIAKISTDKRILVILIGWCFANFLEGVAGFGTPIAIGAGMLWGMGLNPVLASVASIIGNLASTPFGAISILTLTTAEVTNLNPDLLSFYTIVQLAIPLLLTPFLMVLIVSGGKLKSLKGVSLIALISGLSFLGTQFITLTLLGTEMVGVLPPIISLITTVVAVKYLSPEDTPKEYDVAGHINKNEEDTVVPERHILVAALPFILILILFLLTSNLFPTISELLSSVQSSLTVYTGPNPETLTFDWINSPGVLIIIATIIGGMLQGATVSDLVQAFGATIKQIYKTIFTLLAVISTAKVISYSGMISAISTVIILVAGSFYSYIAPVLGIIGGFITGSATSSGILFGVLQAESANVLGVSAVNLVAANSVGASIGKVIAPQAVALAASTTGLSGQESKIFSESIKWISIYIVLSGIISGIVSQLAF